ncbi:MULTISPECIES: hypothetical protein [Sphingobacterium]|uniref:hypothetical protein n=1 Tax=Sphingobacterium TaxID=28453 RepID=UPI0010535933|nr:MULTISPECIES: hypothetical protein [Sphingobacterium]MCW2263135.1 hypothetical protein [Sphingobacterium kitahiroshimense]TCR11882.1 hypothetical protein EDF67_103295 [Sphingobacterium sp. JUb78]
MKKHPFSNEGVMEWLAALYSATVNYQMMEQDLILMCLRSWLISRFDLSEDQIAYINTLTEDFKSNLAQELVFAINNQSDITLDKQTDEKRTGTLARDTVKVTEYESKKTQSNASYISIQADVKTNFNSQLEGHLIIRIYYKLL